MTGSDLSVRLAPLRRFLPPVGSWQAVLWAIAFLSMAALVRLPFDAAVNQRLPPFLTIYPAVVLTSFAGGLRIGAVAAFVGGFMAWALWAAPYGWEIPPYALVTFVVYVLAVGITVATSGLARHLLDACVALEDDRAKQAGETVHRIKNLISVVQALSHKIAAQTPDKDIYLQRFHDHLRALGAAQDILVRQNFHATDIQTLAESALAPFIANTRLKLTGGPILIVPAALVSGLSLALYELATNSTKYGALGGQEGDVELAWRKAGELCKVEWRETGAAISKGKPGLGSALVNGAMSARKDGRVSYDVKPGAIVCTFDWLDDTA